jgi:DNA primase
VLDLHREAEGFFKAKLRDEATGHLSRQYLARRGISLETASRLGLGYAPDAWESLRTHLLSRRFKPQEVVESGLAIPRKEGQGEYDRFRHRLMFPIRDVAGRTLAFGGRALGDAEPKYLNSPETPAYVKGDHLYGLDDAKEPIRREGYAIVVEGYLDLAALRQGGFEHSVASLGTAFTPNQARLLSRYTGRVVVCYDGDAAGAAATQRSLDLLLERKFDVRAVELPTGMDPDDYVRKEGAASFERLVKQAPGWLEYLVRRECSSRDLGRTEEKVAAINALLPRIVRLESPVERASWAGLLADALRIEDDLVLQELKSALRAARPGIRQRHFDREPIREAEARLVAVLLRLGDGRSGALAQLEPADLVGTRVGRIVDAILLHLEEGKEVKLPEVLETLNAEEDRELLTWIAFREGPEIREDEIEGCVKALRLERLVRERRELQRAIERTADPEAVDALLLRKQQLGRQIDALS